MEYVQDGLVQESRSAGWDGMGWDGMGYVGWVDDVGWVDGVRAGGGGGSGDGETTWHRFGAGGNVR